MAAPQQPAITLTGSRGLAGPARYDGSVPGTLPSGLAARSWLPSGMVTFLFTDIEGSTRLARALGSNYRGILADHHRLLRRSLRDFGGAELLTEGDSFFAVFADAGAALEACTEAQRQLAEHRWPVPAIRPQVRMGLHTGYAVPIGDEYASIEVHRAARISAAAHGGQVLCSASTAEAAGVDPSYLRDLGLHRLRGFDDRIRLYQLVTAGLDRWFPRPHTLDDTPHNLPAPVTGFVGRAAEREELRAVLATNRLVTAYGPAGVGKTRLAVQVARDLVDGYEDGVWFADLAGADRADQVPELVAEALGLSPEPARPLVDTIAEHLGGRHCLLTLDTCERQPAPIAYLVARLLAACPRLTVLVTGRESLGLPGELLWRVPPLQLAPAVDGGPSDAVALLLDRVAAVRGGVAAVRPVSRLDLLRTGAAPGVLAVRELRSLDRIARRLDGLPLALELAAARLRTLPVDQLADRLTDPVGALDLLDPPAGRTGLRPVDGPAPARHASLRASIGWSYRSLPASAARLLCWLSICPGPVDLPTVEWLTDEWPDSTFADLALLVDCSLVQVDYPDGSTRYRLLGPIRYYARQRLSETGEELAARSRYRSWRQRVPAVPHPRAFAEPLPLAGSPALL